MSSSDNMEMTVMVKLMILKKKSRKKYSCSECDKVFQYCSPFLRHRKSHNKLN